MLNTRKLLTKILWILFGLAMLWSNMTIAEGFKITPSPEIRESWTHFALGMSWFSFFLPWFFATATQDSPYFLGKLLGNFKRVIPIAGYSAIATLLASGLYYLELKREARISRETLLTKKAGHCLTPIRDLTITPKSLQEKPRLELGYRGTLGFCRVERLLELVETEKSLVCPNAANAGNPACLQAAIETLSNSQEPLTTDAALVLAKMLPEAFARWIPSPLEKDLALAETFVLIASLDKKWESESLSPALAAELAKALPPAASPEESQRLLFTYKTLLMAEEKIQAIELERSKRAPTAEAEPHPRLSETKRKFDELALAHQYTTEKAKLHKQLHKELLRTFARDMQKE